MAITGSMVRNLSAMDWNTGFAKELNDVNMRHRIALYGLRMPPAQIYSQPSAALPGKEEHITLYADRDGELDRFFDDGKEFGGTGKNWTGPQDADRFAKAAALITQRAPQPMVPDQVTTGTKLAFIRVDVT